MKQVILGIFNFLIDSLKKLSKENDDLKQMLTSQMAQNAELRGIIRETRFAIEGLDKHLEEKEGIFVRLPLVGVNAWRWNKNMERPTLEPSILTKTHYSQWHGFLTDGAFIKV